MSRSAPPRIQPVLYRLRYSTTAAEGLAIDSGSLIDVSDRGIPQANATQFISSALCLEASIHLRRLAYAREQLAVAISKSHVTDGWRLGEEPPLAATLSLS